MWYNTTNLWAWSLQEIIRGIEASFTVLSQLVEAICELYPGQTRRADLDRAGLMAACKAAAEPGDGDAPRRSSSGYDSATEAFSP